MLFNSIHFLLFFILTITFYYVIPWKLRNYLLFAASVYFYMVFIPVYILILFFIIIVDFFIAQSIEKRDSPLSRKALLTTAIFSNLGILFLFKYFNFFNENIVYIASLFGIEYQPIALSLILPIGLSFHTFQSISYTIDVYNKKISPEKNFINYSVYVLFFPQLVAGPIERAGHILPQLRQPRNFLWDNITIGSQIMLWGLFKKVVIADRLGIYVDNVYGQVGEHNAATYALATYCFAIQIYCDFSGYSDIARGAARTLGVDMIRNFDRPYLVSNIREFWHRWHISLSTWLRDYLYFSLGGSRHGLTRTILALMATMILGGLWHGASWNFLIWGAIHGALLSFSHIVKPYWPNSPSNEFVKFLLKLCGIFITFNLVCFTWIFFRAETLSDSYIILTTLLTKWDWPYMQQNTLLMGGVGVLVLLIVEVMQTRLGSLTAAIARQPLVIRWLIWLTLIFSIVLFGVEAGTQFIYFQF